MFIVLGKKNNQIHCMRLKNYKLVITCTCIFVVGGFSCGLISPLMGYRRINIPGIFFSFSASQFLIPKDL